MLKKLLALPVLLLLAAAHTDATSHRGHSDHAAHASGWAPYIELLLDSTAGPAASGGHEGGGGRAHPLLRLHAWRKARDSSAARRLSLLRRTAPGRLATPPAAVPVALERAGLLYRTQSHTWREAEPGATNSWRMAG